MGRDSDTRRTNGRYQEHVEFGIDLLRPHVLDPMMAMTVRVVSFDVNIVSSMLKSREESILFSMSSLDIVLKITSTDDFTTVFRTLPMLCEVRGTSTGWRPRKREYRPDVICVK